MKDTLTLKDTKMVIAKLVANERCTWSFEELEGLLSEVGYRHASSQVVPFLRKLRDLEMWHPLAMFSVRFAGQYKYLKDDVISHVGALDRLRQTAFPDGEEG